VTMGTCHATDHKCVNLGTINGAASEGGIVAEYPLKKTVAAAVNGYAQHAWASMTDAEITTFNAKCRTAVLLIKFSDAANAGVQNLLEVTADDEDTDADGAAPKYRSSGLKSLGVEHVGMPDYQLGSQGSYAIGGSSQSYAVEIPTAIGAAQGLKVDMVRSEQLNTAGTAFESAWAAAQTTFSVFTYETLNNYAEVQTLNLESYEGDKEDAPKLAASGKAVYTAEEIGAISTASYDEVLQCSNQGACGYDTGMCTCASGFTGEACGTQVSFV